MPRAKRSRLRKFTRAHDRRAQDLPLNAQVAAVEIDDPARVPEMKLVPAAPATKRAAMPPKETASIPDAHPNANTGPPSNNPPDAPPAKPKSAKEQKIEQELQGIQQQLQNGGGKLTPQAEADLQATGARRQRELQHISDDLQNDVTAERNDILQKASLRMQEVVKKVAEEKGADMVVDTQTTIYFKPTMEITADVLAAYNKAHPAAK